MQASVSISYLQSLGYSAWDLNIAAQNVSYQCRREITASQVIFTIPYTGCGTIKQVSQGLPTLFPSCQTSLQWPRPLGFKLRCWCHQDTSLGHRDVAFQ